MRLKNGIVLNVSYLSEDLRLSAGKWDDLYAWEFKEKLFQKKKDEYARLYLEDTINQLKEVKSFSGISYLEIGCGEFFVGQALARTCGFVIGVDISENALKIAKAFLDKNHVRNYLLVQGDICHMPLKNNCIDLIYGGGVIEHFKDTGACLSELYRVLKRGGVSFNTVPYLNIGSLTYRQVWGNIPNVPVLKQTAEFIHIKVLKAKHMRFGYEMSFLGRTLISLHKKAGFRKVDVARYKVSLFFEFLPASMKPFFSFLAQRSKLFWPMVKVIGIK